MKFNTQSEPQRYGKLKSSQRHPVDYSYGGEAAVIPPQGTVENVDREKLGKIPLGVKFMPYPVKKPDNK